MFIFLTGCDLFSQFEERVATAFEEFGSQFKNQSEPHFFMLTWQNDPTTTMTIDWHTTMPANFFKLPESAALCRDSVPDKPDSVTQPTGSAFIPSISSTGLPALLKPPAPHGHHITPACMPSAYTIIYRLEGELGWMSAEGRSEAFPYTPRRYIHRAELTDLIPDQRYEFRFTTEGKLYSCRTMPEDLKRPVRFVTGSHLIHYKVWMGALNSIITSSKPDFIVLGDDPVIADSQINMEDRWHGNLQSWSRTMITEDGRVIPFVAGISYHKTTHHSDEFRYEQTDEFRIQENSFNHSLMTFPGQPGYGVTDFGDYLSIFLLDSGHANSISGKQLSWLTQALDRRSETLYKIPFYHISAWPSAISYNSPPRIDLLENWVPLFEKHNIRMVIENHGSDYKRTHPMLNNRIDADGIHYIGGGGGDDSRLKRADLSNHTYLNRTENTRHIVLVTLTEDEAGLQIFDDAGKQFDELIIRHTVRSRQSH